MADVVDVVELVVVGVVVVVAAAAVASSSLSSSKFLFTGTNFTIVYR